MQYQNWPFRYYISTLGEGERGPGGIKDHDNGPIPTLSEIRACQYSPHVCIINKYYNYEDHRHGPQVSKKYI